MRSCIILALIPLSLASFVSTWADWCHCGCNGDGVLIRTRVCVTQSALDQLPVGELECNRTGVYPSIYGHNDLWWEEAEECDPHRSCPEAGKPTGTPWSCENRSATISTESSCACKSESKIDAWKIIDVLIIVVGLLAVICGILLLYLICTVGPRMREFTLDIKKEIAAGLPESFGRPSLVPPQFMDLSFPSESQIFALIIHLHP